MVQNIPDYKPEEIDRLYEAMTPAEKKEFDALFSGGRSPETLAIEEAGPETCPPGEILSDKAFRRAGEGFGRTNLRLRALSTEGDVSNSSNYPDGCRHRQSTLIQFEVFGFIDFPHPATAQ